MGSARILVVEDEAIVARDIVRQLERFGHHVVASTTRGEDAVELAAQLLPDLVLMDIQLAGSVDGIDAAQAIRRKSNVPVVFLTAFATHNVLQRAKQASPFGYLVKPFDPQQLETAIEIALHQHEVEASLRESREELATILRTATDAFLLGDAQGRLLDVNEATCALLGYAREELLAMTVANLAPDEAPEELAQARSRILTLGSARFERHLRRKDGSFVEVEITANKLPIGEGRFMSFARDISARKRADEERDATVRMLKLINQPNSLDALMREVTVLLRDWSGCSAVGIRLSDGEDFPYFETRGFPPTFVQAERYLCEHDRNGRIARDAGGNPVLDCMCGNVLCGRFDATKPFFTTRGSFWTNSTTRLLAQTSEADRRGRTRNRCNGEGYESVALVPLRVGNETYGLLQFNDKRPDRFRQSASPCLRGWPTAWPSPSRNERFRPHARSARSVSAVCWNRPRTTPTPWTIVTAGKCRPATASGCEKVTGYTSDEFAARASLWLDMVVPEDRAAVLAFANRIDWGEAPTPIEHRIVHKNGSIRWVRNTVVSRPAPASHGFVHRRADFGHHGSQTARIATATGAEDGGHGPARWRRGPRLQQHPGHHADGARALARRAWHLPRAFARPCASWKPRWVAPQD